MIKDISYTDYKRKSDIHGTVLYPAVMVAPVQKDVLHYIAQSDRISSICDPFHGSGTALYESCIEFPNAVIHGCDINPYANLITRTKLEGISDRIERDITKLANSIEHNNETDILEFDNREKWFRDDIALSLTRIRSSIQKIEDKQDRDYFWCMLGDVIRRYSNTRSSTYKLHAKPQDRIEAMRDNVIKDFLSAVKRNYKMYDSVHCNNYRLFKQDAIQFAKGLKDNCYDLVITSPPYGDNLTTVPYGQFSSLALRWIDEKDLIMDGWETSSYSTIDRKSLGSGQKDKALSKKQKELIEPYIDKISNNKKQKVLYFFHDYFECLNELIRATDKYIVLTLGNRKVDGVTIELAAISGEYLKYKGFKEKQTISRAIMNKRTPKLTSSVNNAPVESIKEEHVLIYKANIF